MKYMIKLFIIYIIFISQNFVQIANQESTGFQHVKLSQENGAKCLDGSPPSLWVKRGDPKKFLVVIQGGSWAVESDIEDVKDKYVEALNSKFGSSSNSYFLKPFEGEYLTSIHKSLNPYFYKYTIVQINNCDQSGQQGYREEPFTHKGKQIWLRGRQNFIESIKYLYDELNMQNAENVTFGGFSAGAQSLYYWMNHFGDELLQKNPNVTFQGFSDSGIFLDRQNMHTKEYNWRKQYQTLFTLTNENEDPINEECVKDFPNEKHRCMFAENNIKYIRYKLLIIQNQYDPSTGANILGTNCLRFRNDWRVSEYNAFEEYRGELLDFLNEVQNNYPIKHSIFSAACRSHTTAYKKQFNNYDVTIPSGSQFNLQEALRQFILKEQHVIRIDLDGVWPDANPQCKDLLINKSFDNFTDMVQLYIGDKNIIMYFLTFYVILWIFLNFGRKDNQMAGSKNKKKSDKKDLTYLEFENQSENYDVEE